jgi:hypothetical protein
MYSITENIYYSQLSSVALLLQPEPKCFTSYNTMKGLGSLSLCAIVLRSSPPSHVSTCNSQRSSQLFCVHYTNELHSGEMSHYCRLFLTSYAQRQSPDTKCRIVHMTMNENSWNHVHISHRPRNSMSRQQRSSYQHLLQIYRPACGGNSKERTGGNINEKYERFFHSSKFDFSLVTG